MKKMIKLSLVAAVAVAGLTTTASAKSLNDAIQNVSVSGMMRLWTESINDGSTDAATATSNDFDTDIKFVNKLSDTSTIVIKVEADSANNTGGNVATKESKLDTVVSNAYLSQKVAGATVTTGRQGVPGPFTDSAGGSGVVVLAPVGSVTIAGGYFNNTSIAPALDASELAIIGKAGNIAYDVWYASVQDAGTFTSLHANAKVAGLTIDARTSAGTSDATGAKTGTLTKVVASGKAGAIGYVAGIAMTGTDNDVANIAIDGDNDAKTDFKVWQASIGDASDATAILIGASTKIGAVSIGAKYVSVGYTARGEAAVTGKPAVNGTQDPVTGEFTPGTAAVVASDATTAKDYTGTELLIDVSYSIAKNVKLSGKYSVANNGMTGAKDSTKTRVALKYTF